MKILVDVRCNRVYEFGEIEKGIFPEADPNTELWKVSNEKGVFYAVADGFRVVEVEEIPENYFKCTYDEVNGFVEYEIPKTPEQIMEEEIKNLKEQNQMLTDCILEIADIIYA